MRLFLLHCGFLDVEGSVIIPEAAPCSRVKLPVLAVLLQVAGRNLLVDTGLPEFCVGNPAALSKTNEAEPFRMIPLLERRQTILQQLSELGLGPADIHQVVNSHLHFDHCGGNRQLRNCDFLVDALELEAAQTSTDYMPVFDGPELRLQTFEGDYELAPNAELLATPGHTPGHHSLLVRLPETGSLLFTFDAVYTKALWEQNVLGACIHKRLARQSMDRLRKVAEDTDAKLIFGHDLEQSEELRIAPRFYN
jgi:N-acyl homoserine lactone hydrolase